MMCFHKRSSRVSRLDPARSLLLWIVWWCAVSALAETSSRRSSPIVDQAEFGIWDADSHGVVRLALTRTVPLELGVLYGWRLHLAGTNTSVRVREVLTLPAAPETWGTNRAVRVSTDRKTASVERRAQLQDGWVVGVIGVADGDPEGKHRLAIDIEGQPARTFEFETRQGAPLPDH